MGHQVYLPGWLNNHSHAQCPVPLLTVPKPKRDTCPHCTAAHPVQVPYRLCTAFAACWQITSTTTTTTITNSSSSSVLMYHLYVSALVWVLVGTAPEGTSSAGLKVFNRILKSMRQQLQQAGQHLPGAVRCGAGSSTPAAGAADAGLGDRSAATQGNQWNSGPRTHGAACHQPQQPN